MVFSRNEFDNKTWAELRDKETQIRERLLRAADVTNLVKRYISAPWVNQIPDIENLGMAADLIAASQTHSNSRPDVVMGIPYSGIPLAVLVSERLRVPFAPGRKGTVHPGSWKAPMLVSGKVPSFTTEVPGEGFVFNGAQPGDTALIVDDILAYGHTMGLVMRELRLQGVEVGGAVYLDKSFQGGNKRIQDMGVPLFSVVNVTGLYLDEFGVGRVELGQSHFFDE